MMANDDPRKVLAIIHGVVRGLTVTVWLVQAPEGNVLLADEAVSTMDEAEAIANRCAVAVGVPLHQVEIQQRR